MMNHFEYKPVTKCERSEKCYIRLGHFIWPEQGKEKKINQGKKNQLNLVGTFNGIWEESIGININKAMDLLR